MAVSVTDSAPSIDLTEAARRLGVHYMTAYRYVRLGRLPATRSGGRWWISPDDLASVTPGPVRTRSRRRTTDVPPRGRRGHPSRVYASRLEDRLVAGDEPGAWAVVQATLASGADPTQVVLRTIGPALRSIGDGWESGRLSVFDEHRATAVAVRVLGRLGPLFRRPGRTGGTVLLAGVAGDPHALPVALTADVLRGMGFAVIDLGANTPVEAVVDAVVANPALVAVGVSVSADGHASAARRTAAAVRRVRPGTPVAMGGPAVPDLATARSLGADLWAADAEQFATVLQELPR